ncbi:DUF535 family protein [Lichenihabitans sp. PAMC28606]|uniref:DUF535 family protein n=1 Tax=Lichenihabitans sp. PAMC28606 TaxID=2880932 RepID=UPI001D0A329F|nr:DUF535 family protein [Lichenihabitans sp. PAMC28606]UDL96221.1 DUF535 family protein [Lichenihabitans sp. PAMC28606]
MLATRRDVIECYKRILGRDAESDKVVDFHLSNGIDVWSLIQTFLDTEERKLKEDVGSALSITKCFRAEYLARNIQRDDRTIYFLDNMRFLRSLLTATAFERLLHGEIVLYATQDCEVVVHFSRDVFIEGEISLIARFQGQPLYVTSFTFVRGEMLHVDRDWVVLISRMQGIGGTKDLSRHVTKLLGEITPQALLFVVLSGLAERSGVDMIMATTACNQVCYSQTVEALLRRNYDEFLTSLGASEPKDGFFTITVPLQHKSLTLIKAIHRIRSRAKRRLKASIAEAAGGVWAGLLRPRHA